MNSLLIISNILLWLLLIGLGFTVYVLTRQTGILYERVAPAGALMVNQVLQDVPYVVSEVLVKSYGVSKLPCAVLLRADATIVSLGILNSREHLKSLSEAEALGVDSIQTYLAQREMAEKTDKVL